MRSFAIFLGLIAFGLLGIVVLGYPAWELSQALGLDFKFHRVASRIAMLTLLIGFVFVARRLQVADRASLGYGVPRREFLRSLGGGWLLGAVTMLPVLATMVLLDMRELKPGFAPTAGHWMTLAATGLVTGLVVAFIEETFLRGAMMTAIARESGFTRAILLTTSMGPHCPSGDRLLSSLAAAYGPRLRRTSARGFIAKSELSGAALAGLLG